MEFKDKTHDTDSCKDAWEEFYKKVYPRFFGKTLDFSRLDDRETSTKCKRWYIQLLDGTKAKRDYPKFKMAGDCIFNFNEKKADKFSKLVVTAEGNALLESCCERHHSFENFAFMPITGGMNCQKGRTPFDRPDIHIKEINSFFLQENDTILSRAGANRKALVWYLSLFDDVYDYMEKIYFISDREFIEEFLRFADKEICDEESAIAYMQLALTFWEKRKVAYSKYINDASE